MNQLPITKFSAHNKAWTADCLGPADIEFRLSSRAEAELSSVLGKILQFDPEALDIMDGALPAVRAEIEVLRHKVESTVGFALLHPISGLNDPEQCRAVSWIIGQMLGDPLGQNEAGQRLVSVYDRDRTRRMSDGARYHQTREGGSLHTDNVNFKERWDYLIMTCVAAAMIGGESVLVSGLTVYNVLQETTPQAVDILCKDFLWEGRGFSGQVFPAPIISFNEWGEPEFRYLRPYLTSAHKKADQPLTEAQIWALDSLDSVLETSALQFRYKLEAGHALIINDNQIFHGRTSFSDYFDGVIYAPELRATRKRFNRFIDRVWIKARARNNSTKM